MNSTYEEIKGQYDALKTSQHFQQWNMLFAAFILSMAPIVILFFGCQKYIVKGITDGSLKG